MGDIIQRLRGQLQNCVSHLERAKRQRSDRAYDAAIESANRALYETLIDETPTITLKPYTGNGERPEDVPEDDDNEFYVIATWVDDSYSGLVTHICDHEDVPWKDVYHYAVVKVREGE